MVKELKELGIRVQFKIGFILFYLNDGNEVLAAAIVGLRLALEVLIVEVDAVEQVARQEVLDALGKAVAQCVGLRQRIGDVLGIFQGEGGARGSQRDDDLDVWIARAQRREVL